VKSRLPLVVAVCAAITLTACTSGGEDDVTSAPSASPTTQPAPERTELTARQRAQQLNALAPPSFDAEYLLRSKGKRPDARVRMRTSGDRFRLDITHGRRTAMLTYVPRGVISCQVVQPRDKNDRRRRSCFLVSHKLGGLPDLFDPEVQRLFGSTKRALTMSRSAVTVKRAGTWHAHHGLGPAECFDIKGKDVDPGTYCYLSRPGPTIGMLARATFPSGALEIRDVNKVKRTNVFKPPVKPTPLPNL
jgi:hypothetical protein